MATDTIILAALTVVCIDCTRALTGALIRFMRSVKQRVDRQRQQQQYLTITAPVKAESHYDFD